MNQPIATLDLPGNIINKFEKNGFYYCDDLKENPEDVLAKVNVSNWPSISAAPPSKTALELYREESLWSPPTSFIPQLDVLLRDKLQPGSITELTGFPGAGKTQVCFHLSVGVDGDVFFISTNNNFASHRVREIAEKYGGDAEAILGRIYRLEATDPVELLAAVQFLETWIQEHEQLRLLIIDSVSWPLKQRPITERTSLIYTIFQRIRALAGLHKFAIVVTNDMTTRVSGGRAFNTSSFGDSFYHIVNNRILLSKRNSSFEAKILKSVANGPQQTQFQL